ncbi:MAG: agmatine deiminase family protein [Gammaproteobacteria bacterium]
MNAHQNTPDTSASLSRPLSSSWRLLPEWHTQLGVLLAWPHADTDWREQLASTQATYLELIHAISTVEVAWLIVPNAAVEAEFKHLWTHFLTQTSRRAPPAQHLKLITAPYDDTWLRDTGPLSLSSHTRTPLTPPATGAATSDTPITPDTSILKLATFRFNGWGNKFPHQRDRVLAEYLCHHQLWQHDILAKASFESIDLIAEGGNIETNGAGILLTQTHCLRHDNRPNGLSTQDWERVFQHRLGMEQIWWLDHGQIAGDDTDGHIDTLVRFVAPDHLVYQRCDEADYPFADSLARLEQQLHAWQRDPLYHVNGKAIRLSALPWPSPIVDDAGERLPATYANFLIINQRVLVPIYEVPEDQEALSCLQTCFPDRTIIGIPCRPLINQGGSLHCITMQISSPYG